MTDTVKILLVYLLLIACLLLGVRAYAAECGGAVTCACGDTVIDSYTMGANLSCSSGHGLIISNAVDGKTLDCASFNIALSPAWTSGDSDKYGIYLSGTTADQVQGWTIKNCDTVSGFRVGIRLKEASYNTLLSNSVLNNGDATADVGYGIEITQNSNYNVLTTNTVDGSGDEGIHASYDIGTTYSGNVIKGSGRENCYLFHSVNGTMTNDDCGAAADGSTTALYCKGCQDYTFTGVDFKNKIVHLTGAAERNTFTNGTMEAGFRLDQYEQTDGDQTTYNYPRDNTLESVAITASTNCLRIENATGTTIDGVTFTTCTTKLLGASTDSAGIFYKATDVTFVGVDPYSGTNTVSIDGGVTVSVAFTLDLTIENGATDPIEGATVTLTDAAGNQVFSILTDENGQLPQQAITVRSGKMPIALTPHRRVIVAPGYVTSSQDVTMSSNTTTTVTLSAQ